jgi:signal transduction histidine kinase
MKQLLLLCFLLINTFLLAQPKEADSLQGRLRLQLTYPQRADVLYELSKTWQKTDPDSAYHYALQLEALAKKNNDNTGLSKAALMVARYLNRTGKPDEGLALCEKNIQQLQKDTAHQLLLAAFYLVKGQCLMAVNKKEDALTDFYASLKIAEQENSPADIVAAYSNIGWVYMELEQYQNALAEFYKAQNLGEANLQNVPSHFLSVIYNNMASCYGATGKIDSAYFYTQKSIAIALKNNDYADAANGFNLLGEALMEEKKYDEALKNLLQAKMLREKVGNPFYIVSDMALLANLYGAMGRPTDGIKTSKAAIILARENKLDAKLPLLYQSLAGNYELAGNYQEAAQTFKYLNLLKDSVFAKTSAESLAKMQVQYETEKKETENNLLKKDNELKAAQLSNKSRTIYILIAGALLMVTLLFVWATMIRLRKKESELKAIAQLQKEKERIARDLHDNVGGQLSYIIYSLDGFNDESKEKQVEITESINQSVRNVISNLRETIWAISDANISWQDFSDKLKIYARNLFKHTDVKINFAEKIQPGKELNALVGLNLYRICQEILTNAFKHSHANAIDIHLQSESDKLLLSLADNGKGFDKSEKKEACYGLQNLYKRAGESGITLTLETETGSGTKYELVV